LIKVEVVLQVVSSLALLFRLSVRQHQIFCGAFFTVPLLSVECEEEGQLILDAVNEIILEVDGLLESRRVLLTAFCETKIKWINTRFSRSVVMALTELLKHLEVFRR